MLMRTIFSSLSQPPSFLYIPAHTHQAFYQLFLPKGEQTEKKFHNFKNNLSSSLS